jgi:hypothetical protein
MTDSVVFNIPAQRAKQYRGRPIIARSEQASELVAQLPDESFENLAYVQLLSLDGEIDDLIHWGQSLPVDIVMRDPVEFPKLYRFADLLENHPVRVSIPVATHCYKAAKLAVSLNFAVKLVLTEQPDEALIAELAQILELYLHRPNVAQPVEYFHSTFLEFFHEQANTLWSVQEEDPTVVRYITGDGKETISPRFNGMSFGADLGSFVVDYQKTLLAEKAECESCEFWNNCGGYFKWPARQYSCDGVKKLFRTLQEAAGELRRELETFDESQGGKQP